MPAENPQPSAWFNYRRKRFWALLLVALYTVAGFLIVPWALGRLGPELIRDNTFREATIGNISFNPYALRLQVNDFALIDTDARNLIEFESLVVNLSFIELFRLTLGFDEIALDKPKALIARYAFADSNWGRVLNEIEAADTSAPAEPETQTDNSGGLRLHIDKLAINDGVLQLEDALTEETFNTRIGPIGIAVNNISTLENVSGTQTINLVTENGMELNWAGTLQLNPLVSAGNISMSGTPIPTVYRYFQKQLNFTLDNCCLEISFDYDLQSLPEGDVEANIANADILLSNLNLNTQDGNAPIFRLPALHISGGSLAWPQQTAHIERILLDKPELYAWLNEAGVANLEELVLADETTDETAAGDATTEPSDTADSDAEAAQSWAVTLGEFRIESMRLNFVDNTLNTPGTLELNPMTLSVTDISTAPNSQWPLSYNATLGSGGTLGFSGALTVQPDILAEGQLTIAALGLPVLQPWVAEAAQVKLESGTLNIDAALGSTPAETLSVVGNIDVLDLGISDTLKEESLVGWQRLGLQQTSLKLDGNELSIAKLEVEKPFVRVLIAADGTTNFESLATEEENTTESESKSDKEAAAETAPPMIIKVVTTSIADGAVDFSDLSLPLPFRVMISEFGGKLSAIDSTSQQASKLDLKGRVGEYGLTTLTGEVSVMAPTEQTDVQLDFQNLSMPTLSPYTAEFVGRKIADGKLNLALDYKLKDNKIVGDNNIVLTDFSLGEDIPSENAMSLPLDLALALLTDANGKIDLEMQISGDMEDPAFSASGIILKAFANIITKAATAPFNLLGKLVPGGSSLDLEAIDFDAGKADLNPPEREKLTQISTALLERPTLQLQINGGYSLDADTQAMQSINLNNQIASITGEPESADELSGKNLKALEKLAKQQLPDLSLAALRDEYQTVNPDSGKSQPDELAYIAGLRERLEAAQPVDNGALIILGENRRDMMLAFLESTNTLPANQYIGGTPAKAETEDRGRVRVPLVINPVPAAD